MEILDILRSVAIRFVKADAPPDLFITDLIEGLRGRYRFLEVPDRVSEIDPTQGLKFALGRFETHIIDKLDVYDSGLVVEAKVDSETLDRLIDDILEWAGKEFGVTYEEATPVARTYLTVIEVRPEAPLNGLLSLLDNVRSALTKMLEQGGFSIAPFTVNGLSLHTEAEGAEPMRPGKFVFERRAGHSAEENIYYSEAPVALADHQKLLETFEQSF